MLLDKEQIPLIKVNKINTNNQIKNNNPQTNNINKSNIIKKNNNNNQSLSQMKQKKLKD